MKVHWSDLACSSRSQLNAQLGWARGCGRGARPCRALPPLPRGQHPPSAPTHGNNRSSKLDSFSGLICPGRGCISNCGKEVQLWNRNSHKIVATSWAEQPPPPPPRPHLSDPGRLGISFVPPTPALPNKREKERENNICSGPPSVRLWFICLQPGPPQLKQKINENVVGEKAGKLLKKKKKFVNGRMCLCIHC